MANYANLKAAIQQVIKTNGNEEITGALLQQSLLAMINSLGGYYQFAGIATPSTNPGTPDQNVFYLAATAGTYSNFGGIVLAENEVAILKYNGTWAKDTSGFASSEKVNQLDIEVNGIPAVNISLIGQSQQTQVECHLDAGKTYTVTTNAQVQLSTRYTSDGANVETIGVGQFTPNVPRVFTPQYTTDWLRIGSTSTASIDITITSPGTDGLDDRVEDLEERMDAAETEISSLSGIPDRMTAAENAISDAENAIADAEDEIAKIQEVVDGVPAVNYSFENVPAYTNKVCHLDAGKTYIITCSENATLSTRYTDSGEAVEIFPQFTANTPRAVTPNYTTEILRVGSIGGGAVSVNVSVTADKETGLSDKVSDLLNDIIAKKYGYLKNLNENSIWEKGAINSSGVNVNSGTDATRNVRTKTFIASEIQFVQCPKTNRLDVFEYASNGTFIKVYNLANKPMPILAPEKKYRLQVKPIYGQTNEITIAEAVEQVYLFSPISPYKKPIFWGNIPFHHWYEGRQNDYTLFNYSSGYSDVIDAFDALATSHSTLITAEDLGTASDGQTLRKYTINPINIAQEFENYGTTAGDGANSQGASCEPYRYIPTIFIVGGQHGFEKSSAFGLYYFVKDLMEKWDDDSVLEYIRTSVKLVIIPILNPWGFDNNSYVNANGVNLNRNWWSPKWTKYTGSTPTEATGDAPFDQPETAACRDALLACPEALLVVDYHTAGSDSVPNMRSLNWCQLYEYGDDYYNRFTQMCVTHMRQMTIHFNKEFSLNYPENQPAGHITWENGNIGRLFQYACHKNFIGVTFEGFNGFYGQSSYTADVKKANSELIGNFIMSVLRGYSLV